MLLSPALTCLCRAEASYCSLPGTLVKLLLPKCQFDLVRFDWVSLIRRRKKMASILLIILFFTPPSSSTTSVLLTHHQQPFLHQPPHPYFLLLLSSESSLPFCFPAREAFTSLYRCSCVRCLCSASPYEPRGATEHLNTKLMTCRAT